MKLHKVNVEDLPKTSHTPFLTYCRKLIKEGNDPNNSAEMYRKGILSLRAKNIGKAAKLAVREEPRVHFVKYKDPTESLKASRKE